MTRLLFWIALVIFIVMAVRSKLRAVMAPYRDAQDRAPAAGPAGAPAAQAIEAPERMACCAACGMHFPSSEAVAVAGSEYCSRHCSRAHAPRA